MSRFFLNIILIFVCVYSAQAGLDGELKVLSAAAPQEYPLAAKILTLSGDVEVDVLVNSDGKVISAKSTQGHPLLKKVSEDAALKWKFSKRVGQSTPQMAHLVFNFRVELNNTINQGEKKNENKSKSTYLPPYQIETVFYKAVSKIATLSRTNGKLEPKYCELHNHRMKTEVIGIRYGLQLLNKDIENFLNAESAFFPNAKDVINGGCVVYPESFEKVEVYYCEKCRKAKKEWLEGRRRSLEKQKQNVTATNL